MSSEHFILLADLRKSMVLEVLVVDPERNRVSLTAKKSLIESDLPRITAIEHAKIGVVALGVIFKVLPKALMIEFYNNVKAVVPIKEVRYITHIGPFDK